MNNLRSDGDRPTFQGYNARGEELAEYDDDPGVIYVVQETGVLLAGALCAPGPDAESRVRHRHHVPAPRGVAKTVGANLNPVEQRPGIKDDQRPRILAGTAPKDGGERMTALGAAASAIEHQRGHIRAAVATVTG